MNRDGHVQSAGCVPHLIEPAVINLDQGTGSHVFSQVQTESLKNLQPSCSRLLRSFELIRLEFRIVRSLDLRVPRFGEYDESIGMRLCPMLHSLLEQRSVAAGQVHHDSHILRVHHLKDFSGSRRVMNNVRLPLAINPGEMRVEIDIRKTRARNMRLGNVQHTLRLIIFQCEGLSFWALRRICPCWYVSSTAHLQAAENSSRGKKAQPL